MNPIYEVFNRQYIEQQVAQQRHFNQILEVQKSVKSLKDFLNSADNIEEPYRQMALDAYCVVLAEYINKHKR